MTDVLTATSFQHGPSVTCEVTGLVIPKLLEENIEWRRRLRQSANNDIGLQKTLKQACASSMLFWLNAFGWTFLQKIVGDDGLEHMVKGMQVHVPFITWQIQDIAIKKIIHCIDTGEDILISKSRDMGASWICLSVFHWYWQFIPGTTFLEMSRNEKYVDQRGNMDSLFEKHRYLHKMQPAWLRPGIDDNLLRIRNTATGNMLVGESTNQHAGQGGRKTAVLLDEFARVREAEEIDLALSDTTSCKIYNSTPQGPTTWFSKLKKSHKCVVLEMPWFHHPLKGRDAELITAYDVEIGYTCPPGKKWISTWYGLQETLRSRRDVAQNIDMCDEQSGRMFFDVREVEEHRSKFQRVPSQVGELLYRIERQDDPDRIKILKSRKVSDIFFMQSKEGKWRLWGELIEGRFDQTHAYTMGIDISAGTSSSNSVITVFDATAKRVVAKFWSATITPYALAEEACKAGLWIGGTTHQPVLNWETNGGVGAQFTTRLKQLGYRPQYVRRNYAKRDRPKSNQRGWHSTTELKEDLLGQLRQGLKTQEFIIACQDSFDEYLGYHYDDLMRLQPGVSDVDEESGASATHGDHAIADGLAFLAKEDTWKPKEIDAIPPKGSFAFRKQKHLRRKRDKAVWNN